MYVNVKGSLAWPTAIMSVLLLLRAHGSGAAMHDTEYGISTGGDPENAKHEKQ
jgi:hypothetical protein